MQGEKCRAIIEAIMKPVNKVQQEAQQQQQVTAKQNAAQDFQSIIDLQATTVDLNQGKSGLAQLLKQVLQKFNEISEELTETEKEYRKSATKAIGYAATKKSEAEQS